MKTHGFSLFLFAFLFTSLSAQQWTDVYELSNGQLPPRAAGANTAIDEQGNLILLGRSERPGADFGDGNIGPSTNAAFLMKRNPLGELQWIQYFSDRLANISGDVEAHKNGDISIVLYTYDALSLTFPDTTLMFDDWFRGSVFWRCDYRGIGKEILPLEGLWVRDTELGPSGELYIAGVFSDTVELGGFRLIPQGEEDVFYGRIAPSGQLLDLQSIPNQGGLVFQELALAPDQSLYLSVGIYDRLFWAGETLVNQSLDKANFNLDKCILKIDPQQGEAWSMHIQNLTQVPPTLGSRGNISVFPITFDEMGNLFISAGIAGIIDIKNTTYSYNDNIRATQVYKINPQGQILWEKSIGSAGDNQAYSVVRSIDHTPDRGLIIGGWFNRTLQVDPDTTLQVNLSPGYGSGQHPFLLKLSAKDGNFIWLSSVESPSSPLSIRDFSVSKTGSIYAAGTLSQGSSILQPQRSLLGAARANLFTGILQDSTFGEFQQRIAGFSYVDTDLDCVPDPGEFGLPFIPIIATPGPYYGVTDPSGNYRMAVDTGTYVVRQMSLEGPGIRGEVYCPVDTIGNLVSISTGQELNNVDFSNDVVTCPQLLITAGNTRHRRCFEGRFELQVWNKGIVEANQVQLHVRLPSYVIFTGASLPHTVDATQGIYTFDIGTLQAFESKSISIEDSISCATLDLLGQTQCIEAWLTPGNQDFACAFNPDWSGASLEMYGLCVDPSLSRFVIKNSGDSDMQRDRMYQVFRNDSLIFETSLRLGTGDSILVDISSKGGTVRVELEQVAFHPQERKLISVVEVCAFPFEISYEDFVPTSFITDKITVCDEVVGSYDPNEKSARPIGFSETHILEPGSVLNYKLEFQNTGTDTAFKVVVVDTLSSFLDLSRLSLQAASHPYTLDITGSENPILSFSFDPILLPDSNVNLLGSQGFVSFSILPKASTPLGTRIENTADIYFDFNPPIRTGTVFHTVDTIPIFAKPEEVSIQGNSLSIGKERLEPGFELFPNPANTSLHIVLKEVNPFSKEEFVLYTIHGHKVKSFALLPGRGQLEHIIEVSELVPGIYFLSRKNHGTLKFQKY